MPPKFGQIREILSFTSLKLISSNSKQIIFKKIIFKENFLIQVVKRIFFKKIITLFPQIFFNP